MPSAFPELARWATYYEIVGSSAGALIGLQFVVMILLVQLEFISDGHGVRAFGTPTVVHFGAALLISAMMSGPWDARFPLAICLGALGTAGVAYSLLVCRHARKHTGYTPDIGDWFWFAILPLVAYTALAAGGFLLSRNAGPCLVVVAAIAFLFLVIGIHNAWDTITYVALTRRGKKPQ